MKEPWKQETSKRGKFIVTLVVIETSTEELLVDENGEPHENEVKDIARILGKGREVIEIEFEKIN